MKMNPGEKKNHLVISHFYFYPLTDRDSPLHADPKTFARVQILTARAHVNSVTMSHPRLKLLELLFRPSRLATHSHRTRGFSHQ